MTTHPQLQCPECARSMRIVEHDSVHLDACNCGALWFDAGELTAWRAGKASKPLASQRQGPTAMPCPRCPSQRLGAHTVATIPVRACPSCHGVFVPAASVGRLEPADKIARDAGAGSGVDSILGGIFEVIANGLFFL